MARCPAGIGSMGLATPSVHPGESGLFYTQPVSDQPETLAFHSTHRGQKQQRPGEARGCGRVGQGSGELRSSEAREEAREWGDHLGRAGQVGAAPAKPCTQRAAEGLQAPESQVPATGHSSRA